MKHAVPTLAFLISLAGVATAQAPWIVTPRTHANPDMAGIQSDDPAAGASAVTIVGPLPAAGSVMRLRVASAQSGQRDFSHTVASGDTVVTIASDLCSQINADTVLQSTNITCQLSPGSSIIGVTNYINNIATPTALTFPQNMVVQQGSAAWEAGPLTYRNRAPAGAVPPPGSNCGQDLFDAPNAAQPGVANTQYVTILCTVISSDPANIGGEWSVFTAQTALGNVSIAKRVGVQRGMVVCDTGSACPPDLGVGTINIPAHYPDGSGPGYFMGTRKICVDPNTNYLYLAQGSACPAGG